LQDKHRCYTLDVLHLAIAEEKLQQKIKDTNTHQPQVNSKDKSIIAIYKCID